MTRTSFTREKGRRLIYLCVILAIVYIWSSVWTALSNYEESQPADVLEDFRRELASQAAGGSCAQILDDCSYSSPYLTNTHAGRILAQALRGKSVTFRPEYSVRTSEGIENRYSIYSDGKRIARIAIRPGGTYSLLKLPVYRVASIEGLVSAELAVPDIENMGVMDVMLSDLKPITNNYVHPDLRELADTDPDVGVPSYYVYHFDSLFAEPEPYALPTEDGETADISVSDLNGMSVVGLSLESSLDESVTEKAKEIFEKYVLFMASEINWDSFKGNVLSTAPIYERIELLEGDMFARQTSCDIENVEVVSTFRWTSRLVNVEIKGDVTVHAPQEDKKYQLDNVFYLFQGEDGEWRICELKEYAYGKEEHSDVFK